VLRYPSGEQIRVGDRVLYTGIPAEIESIEPEHVVIFAVSLDAVTFVDIDETVNLTCNSSVERWRTNWRQIDLSLVTPIRDAYE
jgi:hypothetical protein